MTPAEAVDILGPNLTIFELDHMQFLLRRYGTLHISKEEHALYTEAVDWAFYNWSDYKKASNSSE